MHVFKLFQNFWVLFYFQFAFTLLWKSLGTSAESLKYFSYPSSLKELTWELHNHTFNRNNVIKAYSDCILSSMPYIVSVQFSHSVLCHSTTPWIAAHQASLSITNSWSSLKLMSIESVMPSSHLILCHPLLLLPPIPPSIGVFSRVFSNESTLRMRWPKYWSFSFSVIPSREHPGLISFRMDWLDLLAHSLEWSFSTLEWI